MKTIMRLLLCMALVTQMLAGSVSYATEQLVIEKSNSYGGHLETLKVLTPSEYAKDEEDFITREELVTLLVRMESYRSIPEIPSVPSFKDVQPSHPSYKFVEIAKAMNITNGIGNGYFGLTECVSYQQSCAMIMQIVTRKVNYNTVMEDAKSRMIYSEEAWGQKAIKRKHAYELIAKALFTYDFGINPVGDSLPLDPLANYDGLSELSKLIANEDDDPTLHIDQGGLTSRIIRIDQTIKSTEELKRTEVWRYYQDLLKVENTGEMITKKELMDTVKGYGIDEFRVDMYQWYAIPGEDRPVYTLHVNRHYDYPYVYTSDYMGLRLTTSYLEHIRKLDVIQYEQYGRTMKLTPYVMTFKGVNWNHVRNDMRPYQLIIFLNDDKSIQQTLMLAEDIVAGSEVAHLTMKGNWSAKNHGYYDLDESGLYDKSEVLYYENPEEVTFGFTRTFIDTVDGINRFYDENDGEFIYSNKRGNYQSYAWSIKANAYDKKTYIKIVNAEMNSKSRNAFVEAIKNMSLFDEDKEKLIDYINKKAQIRDIVSPEGITYQMDHPSITAFRVERFD